MLPPIKKDAKSIAKTKHSSVAYFFPKGNILRNTKSIKITHGLHNKIIRVSQDIDNAHNQTIKKIKEKERSAEELHQPPMMATKDNMRDERYFATTHPSRK